MERLNLPTICLDFETYHDPKYRLKDTPIPVYLADRRFKVHGLAWEIDGETGFLKPKEIPAFLDKYRNHGVIAHNTYFDGLILAVKYGWVPPFLYDTRLMAHHVFGPAVDSGLGNDLDSLCKRLGLEGKAGTIDFMEGVVRPSPEQWDAMSVYARTDARRAREAFDLLLPRMSRPEFELWLIDHTLRIYLDKPIRVDAARVDKALADTQERITRSIAEVVGKVVDVPVWVKPKKPRRKKGEEPLPDPAPVLTIENREITEAVLSSDKQFGETLEAAMKLVGDKVPKKRGKKGAIPALSKKDPEFLALKLHADALVSALVKARLAKKSAAQAISRLEQLKTYAKIGGLRTNLVYYGAHTGRFAGGGGFNLQNMPSPVRALDPEERETALQIRRCLIPDAGKKFVGVDAAQIEARVLAWIADEQEIIQAFADGADIYSRFISGVLGEEIRKPNKDTMTPEEYVYNKIMRHIGKESILGLGYGMGTNKFIARLRENPDVLPLIGTDKLPMDMLKSVVPTYRKTYSNIVVLWNQMNEAFHKARVGGKRWVGPIAFENHEMFKSVHVVLPSGRFIHYGGFRQVQNEKGYKEWSFGNGRRVYGGLLTENIVQAVSRDILAEAIYSCEVLGFPVALHIHDSVIGHVEEAKAQACYETLMHVLAEPPEWGAGLVLGAEGEIGDDLSV